MSKLNENKPFLVKESKGVNLFLGLVFLALFISAFFNNDPYENPGFQFRFLYLALIPALLFIRKAFINKTVIIINKQGIFYFGELITRWVDFIDAKIDQDQKLLSIQDNFVLFIRYRDGNRIFRSRIPLRNTYSKAEEEIIEAIRYFYDLNRNR